jgi:hypothetical protein
MNTNEQKVTKRRKFFPDEPLQSSFPSFPFVHDIRGIDVLTLPVSAPTLTIEQRRAFDQ